MGHTQNNLQQTRDVIRYALNSGFVKGKACDFGAGTTKYKSAILQKVSDYTSMDIFPNEGIDVAGDVENAPFKDNEFDTVICTQVLEHTKHPWIVAKEIFRILKPGGIAVVTAPFLVPYHPDPEDNYRFTISGMEILFKDAGFKILEADFYGNHYMAMSEMLHFQFDSPYVRHSRIKNRFFVYLSKFFKFLDSKSRGKAIFANTYVIVQKI